MPAPTCPYCGYLCDAAASALNLEDTVPEPDDYSLCFACGEWLVFTADLGLRKPTDDEFTEIGTDQRMHAARKVWLQAVTGKHK